MQSGTAIRAPGRNAPDADRSLRVGQTRVDIIGTAHVSEKSRRDVRELIESGRYDCVAVELCDKRRRALLGEVSDLDLWEVIRQGRLGEMATTLAVAAYQRRIAERLEVEPGAELKEAVTGAGERNMSLICIDREVGATMRRLSASLSWWKRSMLIQMVIFNLFRHDEVSKEQVEELKGSDTLHAMFDELAGSSKELFDTLIIERDCYMACGILEYIREHPRARVLAVVGAGHVLGVSRVLQRYQFIPARKKIEGLMHHLDAIPKSFRWSRILPAAVVLLILTGFAIGFDQGIGMDLVVDWILINGGLAALGALIAGAHVVTVISAFVAAPLTSINPMIGAGMVTAAVELTVRKPHVHDMRNLREDTTRWAGWRKNRIARTLVIFVLSTIGSAVGTYVGGFHIFSQIS